MPPSDPASLVTHGFLKIPMDLFPPQAASDAPAAEQRTRSETGYERACRINREEELASGMAWDETVQGLQKIRDLIQATNFGLARSEIERLLSELPHDNGPCRAEPMLDRQREAARAYLSKR